MPDSSGNFLPETDEKLEKTGIQNALISDAAIQREVTTSK
jgi:hypothetical protein